MSNNTIKQSVTVNAPRNKVFKALTDAAELMRWFPTKVESDARSGGRFKFTWEFAAAEQNGSQEGKYKDVVPNEKLSYGWQGGPNADTTVEFRLSDSGGATTVQLVHSGWPSSNEGKQLIERHEGPWGFYMQNLKAYLEEGKDERTAKLGQKTA